MNNIDWSTAPAGATHYADERFWIFHQPNWFYFLNNTKEWVPSCSSPHSWKLCMEKQVAEWPEEDRIDAIGTNGNTGEHYTKSATDYLSQGMQILIERGKQYGSNGRECSFGQVAEAFNAITGNELSGSDVCMILALLKLVRQSAQPDRLHEDSLVDGVNYMALYAEMVGKELKK